MHRKLFVFAATLSLSIAAHGQADQTITGTVTDAMCGAHHMMQGATAAKCTRECVKMGSEYAIVSGTKVYTLKGDKATIDKYAGDIVTVKGDLAGNTLTVASITPAHK